MDNVYMEDSGACPNPTGNIGTAGVLIRGGAFSFQGGEGPSGHFPAFSQRRGEGLAAYIYYALSLITLNGATRTRCSSDTHREKDEGSITPNFGSDSESLQPH